MNYRHEHTLADGRLATYELVEDYYEDMSYHYGSYAVIWFQEVKRLEIDGVESEDQEVINEISKHEEL